MTHAEVKKPERPWVIARGPLDTRVARLATQRRVRVLRRAEDAMNSRAFYDFHDHMLATHTRTWARHFGLYLTEITGRAARRTRREMNRERRAWLLGLGRAGRREARLDPPGDYDEMPF